MMGNGTIIDIMRPGQNDEKQQRMTQQCTNLVVVPGDLLMPGFRIFEWEHSHPGGALYECGNNRGQAQVGQAAVR